MRIFVSLFVAVMAAAPALALSCLPHSLEGTFQAAKQSPDSYMVVHGTLEFDEAKLPDGNHEQQHMTPAETRISAQITGRVLGRSGFLRDFSSPVTLIVECYGPWCASAKSGIDYLAFLKKVEGGFELATNPCDGFAFGEPTQKQLRRVKRCFNGGSCRPKRP